MVFNGMIALESGIMVAAMSLVLLIILVITFAFTIKDSDEGQISMVQILK